MCCRYESAASQTRRVCVAGVGPEGGGGEGGGAESVCELHGFVMHTLPAPSPDLSAA